MELILTGAPIAADEAQRIGLVNRVVPAAELMAEARALAAQLATQRADRDALHHQRGQQGPRDAVRRGVPVRGDAVRAGRVDRRHARGDARRFSRSGSRSSRAGRARRTSADASQHARRFEGSATAAGFRFALVVSKYQRLRDRSAAGRGARGARGGRRRRRRHHRRARARARSRFRSRRSTRPRADASTPSSASAA